MTTRQDHYRMAEDLLAEAQDAEEMEMHVDDIARHQRAIALLVARAQVHATLACSKLVV